MLIANPIYDVVFKYLMANLDIAKGVIAAIIDEDIAMLDFKAQESVHNAESGFKVFHLAGNKDGVGFILGNVGITRTFERGDKGDVVTFVVKFAGQGVEVGGFPGLTGSMEGEV